jgi:hypothetical protein
MCPSFLVKNSTLHMEAFHHQTGIISNDNRILTRNDGDINLKVNLTCFIPTTSLEIMTFINTDFLKTSFPKMYLIQF